MAPSLRGAEAVLSLARDPLCIVSVHGLRLLRANKPFLDEFGFGKDAKDTAASAGSLMARASALVDLLLQGSVRKEVARAPSMDLYHTSVRDGATGKVYELSARRCPNREEAWIALTLIPVTPPPLLADHNALPAPAVGRMAEAAALPLTITGGGRHAAKKTAATASAAATALQGRLMLPMWNAPWVADTMVAVNTNLTAITSMAEFIDLTHLSPEQALYSQNIR